MQTIRSRQVYANPWLAVREDAVRRDDGTTAAYAVVESADIALIIPVDGDQLHLVEQYRHPVRGRRWEFPSGSVDPSDGSPRATAARELEEETGLRAESLTQLGAVEISPSTLSQRCWVFLASGLVPGAAAPDPEEADLRTAPFAWAEVERMIRDGTLTDAKTCAAVALLGIHERRA